MSTLQVYNDNINTIANSFNYNIIYFMVSLIIIGYLFKKQQSYFENHIRQLERNFTEIIKNNKNESIDLFSEFERNIFETLSSCQDKNEDLRQNIINLNDKYDDKIFRLYSILDELKETFNIQKNNNENAIINIERNIVETVTNYQDKNEEINLLIKNIEKKIIKKNDDQINKLNKTINENLQYSMSKYQLASESREINENFQGLINSLYNELNNKLNNEYILIGYSKIDDGKSVPQFISSMVDDINLILPQCNLLLLSQLKYLKNIKEIKLTDIMNFEYGHSCKIFYYGKLIQKHHLNYLSGDYYSNCFRDDIDETSFKQHIKNINNEFMQFPNGIFNISKLNESRKFVKEYCSEGILNINNILKENGIKLIIPKNNYLNDLILN